MNGVHDMGGMHGFGPIDRAADGPFMEPAWEQRVDALGEYLMGNHFFTVDAFRYGIERMDPAHYLRAPYFERWLATIEYNLVKDGYITGEEIDARTELLRQQPAATFSPSPANPPRPMPEPAVDASPPPPPARFTVGDAVVARNIHPTSHYRLPRYARSKRGVIVKAHGPQTLPDTNAHRLGKHPEPLYTVRFDARELWGASAEPRQTVTLDLWQSYLEPAPHT